MYKQINKFKNSKGYFLLLNMHEYSHSYYISHPDICNTSKPFLYYSLLEKYAIELPDAEYEIIGRINIDFDLIVEKVNENTPYESYFNYWLFNGINTNQDIKINQAFGEDKYTKWKSTSKESFITLCEAFELNWKCVLVLKQK